MTMIVIMCQRVSSRVVALCHAAFRVPFRIPVMVFLVLVGLINDGSAQSDIDQPQAESAEGRFLLCSMAAERSKIKSGECQIVGVEKSGPGPATPEASDGEMRKVEAETRLSISYRFDGDLTRFDTKADQSHAGDAVSGATDGSVPFFEGHAVRDLEKVAFWRLGDKNVVLYRGGTPFHSQMRAIDVRGLGIFTDSDLDACHQAQDMFNLMGRSYAKVAVSSVSGGVRVLTLSNQDSESNSVISYELKINTDEGFTPVEGIVAEKVAGRNQILCSHRTKWQGMGGTWVPVFHHLEATTTNDEVRSSYEYELAWSKVNEAVDSSVFGYEAFGISTRYGVLDVTTGTARILKPAEDPQRADPPPKMPLIRGLMLVINVVLVAAIGVGLFYRWVVRRKSV